MLTLKLCVTLITIFSSIRVYHTASIYDALESHGLPKGLLPKGVNNFTIKEDGNFEVHLDESCRSKLDNQFEYKKDISGRLSFGQLGNLTGIESLELFVWVSVNGIRVDIPNSGRIHFDLDKGVRKELSLSLFETPADCVAVSQPPGFLTASIEKLDRIQEPQDTRLFGRKRNGRDVM